MQRPATPPQGLRGVHQRIRHFQVSPIGHPAPPVRTRHRSKPRHSLRPRHRWSLCGDVHARWTPSTTSVPIHAVTTTAGSDLAMSAPTVIPVLDGGGSCSVWPSDISFVVFSGASRHHTSCRKAAITWGLSLTLPSPLLSMAVFCPDLGPLRAVLKCEDEPLWAGGYREDRRCDGET